MGTKPTEQYSKEDAQRRFEAALRAALNTPPKPMKDMPRKRAEKRKKSSAVAS